MLRRSFLGLGRASSRWLMVVGRVSAIGALFFGGTGPVFGQGQVGRVDSLTILTERGDPSARAKLAPLAREAVTYAAGHRLDAAAARKTARMALAMASPLSPATMGVTGRELQWRGGAVRALWAALAVDSGDVWSAQQLERLTPYPFVWLGPGRELAHLRALATRLEALPVDLAVTRIRLELEAGSVDSAAFALSKLPAGLLSVASRGHLEAEVAILRGKDSAGCAAYFRGARAIRDSSDAWWYTRDLMWIADSAELLGWRSLGFAPGVRAEWLRGFWNSRDLRDARMPGTRLPEQLRRWRVALRDARWDNDGSTALGVPMAIPIGSFEDMNRIWPLSRILDDRGGLILRHGEPTRRAASPGVQSGDAVTYAWVTPSGPLLVGFSRADGQGSWRYGMVARNVPQGDAMAVCQLDARLCVAAGWGALGPSSGRSAYLQRLRLAYKRMREIAEQTDGNAETFADSLDATAQAFGIAGGGVLVVVSARARQLLPKGTSLDTIVGISAKVRIIIGDTATKEIVLAIDTIGRWVTAAGVAGDAFLSTYLTMPVPVGNWDVSVVISDAEHRVGSGTRFRHVPVVLFDGKRMTISDPILGRRNSGLSWRHNGELVPLNPTNVWRRDEPALLSYEVDGLVPGRIYETRYEVWKTGGHPASPSSVITSKAAAGATTVRVYRELSLRELEPGRYRLVVRVRDTVTLAESVRERMIPVRK